MKDYVAMVFLGVAVLIIIYAINKHINYNEPCDQRSAIEIPVCREIK